MDLTRVESLRERMDWIGCTFEFVVVTPDSHAQIDELTHRHVLYELHDQIMVGLNDWHQKVIRNLPMADYPKPSIRWDLDSAVANPLTRAEIQALTLTETYQRYPRALYTYFRDGFCINECSDEAAQEIFREWLEMIGLEDHEDVVVFDWLETLETYSTEKGVITQDLQRWSDYFGSEYEQGEAWCLTIWNPRKRTVSALAAHVNLQAVSPSLKNIG